MRRAADQIDLPGAHLAIGAVDRKHQFERYIEPLGREETEFDRRYRRKIGIRDEVGNRELHHRTSRAGIVRNTILPIL
jgi:hypothetical protein